MASIGEGLTVLDLSQGMAGSLATMVLADAGAKVIKIEPPKGDWARGQPAWFMWNRGKKSAVLNLKSQEGRSALRALASQADVLVTCYSPGVAERLGIAYDDLALSNPKLVYCSITGFGPLKGSSHLKGYDAIVTAKTGRSMNFSELTKDGAPGFAAVNCASYGAAMFAIVGTMAALYVREKTGRGQKVETSLLQGLLPYDWFWLRWQLEKRGEDPFAGFSRGVPTPQYFVARCKDGRWIQLANAMTHLFYNYMIGIGLGDVLQEPRYMGLPNISAGPDMEELFQKMYGRMLEKTLDEWMHIFIHEFDVAAEPFMTAQQAFEHPQVIHNGNFVELYDPAIGPSRQLGPLAKFTETPLVPQGPSPKLGEHTEEILSSLPKAPQKATISSDNKPMPRYPLAGVTVVEFATWFAGPYGPAILADLGARVIKVEALEGDSFRRFGVMGTRTLQGKESIAVDLKTPEGQKIAHEFIKRADILLHNFRPGAPERLGIDYQTAKTINPRIIYHYAGAYGSTGPYSHRPAMHPIPGAACGGALYQAGRHMPPPTDKELTYPELREVSSHLFRANEGNPDVSSAIGVATALMMALYAREKTGKGQYVETSMVCSNLYANADDFIQYQGKPERLLPDAALRGLHALYCFYKAQDGWVFLACPKEEEWQRFCQAIGRQDLLGDPRFANHELRLKHDEELTKLLDRVLSQQKGAYWESFLTQHGVACAEAYKEDISAFANAEPSVKESGLWVERQHPSLGSYWRLGPIVNFSATDNRLGATCSLGEHTVPLLKELGFSDQEIESLKDSNVVTWQTVPAQV